MATTTALANLQLKKTCTHNETQIYFEKSTVCNVAGNNRYRRCLSPRFTADMGNGWQGKGGEACLPWTLSMEATLSTEGTREKWVDRKVAPFSSSTGKTETTGAGEWRGEEETDSIGEWIYGGGDVNWGRRWNCSYVLIIIWLSYLLPNCQLAFIS